MKILLIILLSCLNTANASFPELFGPSAGSISIGGQPERKSAANNYQAAALLGYSENTQFSFNTFYVSTHFKSINNIVIRNQSNTVNTFERGDVKTNLTPTAMFGAHLSTPLFAPSGPKFNFSVIAPFDRLMEASSGDPYQPKYVMYEERILRPSLHFSLAQSFSDWSFSLGAMTGFQSTGETYFVTRTTSGNPSLGKVSFNAKPSLGATASIAKRNDHSTSYLAFQQGMKSRLETQATGETEIASNSSFPFDFDVSTLLYFDPMTIRLGHQVERERIRIHFALEYQQWENYSPSTLKLKKRGGVINGSRNYEDLNPRDIFIPRLGFEYDLGDTWTIKSGYFYRQTPLPTEDLKHSGNSLDTDKHVVSLGLGKIIKISQRDVTLDVAYQGHFLKNQKVTKTSNREDGDPSEPKIGSPGYRVGGMIHVLGLGLTWMY